MWGLPDAHKKVAILVVFNHRFDQNLDRLRAIYRDRFSDVFFLVPFYDGSDEDVIPVYSTSYTFQSFFTYAYEKIKSLNFDYWFIVADDMIINPKINEDNFETVFNITPSDNFIPILTRLDESTDWYHAHNAASFRLDVPYVNIKNCLPEKSVTEKKLLEYNVAPRPLSAEKIFKRYETVEQKAAAFGLPYLRYIKGRNNDVSLDYPLCRGYSDIFIVGGANVSQFVMLCGAFASAGLFVETAVPTSLLLSATGRVVLQKEISLRGAAIWGDVDIKEFETKFDSSLEKLINEFDRNRLFYHPVKLSRWS